MAEHAQPERCDNTCNALLCDNTCNAARMLVTHGVVSSVGKGACATESCGGGQICSTSHGSTTVAQWLRK
eukprot:15476139-Alexandrium_andersonii.AAC.1